MNAKVLHFSVLNFDRDGETAKGFRANSMRTRNLAFERV
jgi:hypothetical protein